MRKFLIALALFPTVAAQAQQPQVLREGMHATTEWRVVPSMKYDALCLFDVLSGDPYYQKWYRADYQRWWPLLTVREKAAFSEVKYHLKDEQGGVVGATLAMYFSASPAQSFDQMIAAVEHPAPMYAALENTPYYDPGEASRFDESREAIAIGLRALERIGFPRYWQQNVAPRIEQRAAYVLPTLERYNIIPAIEARLGHPFPSDVVTIYLLEYSQPHGIRITGMQLITHESYPWDYTLRNAIHELLHSPFRRDNPAVFDAEELLGRDPLLGYIIANHNPSFGYNNAHGYVEEDSVQALEQIIEDGFHVAQPPEAYWREQDGGMHVLAAAMYADMQADEARAPLPDFETWFLEGVQAGRFQGQPLVDAAASVVGADWLARRWPVSRQIPPPPRLSR